MFGLHRKACFFKRLKSAALVTANSLLPSSDGTEILGSDERDSKKPQIPTPGRKEGDPTELPVLLGPGTGAREHPLAVPDLCI